VRATERERNWWMTRMRLDIQHIETERKRVRKERSSSSSSSSAIELNKKKKKNREKKRRNRGRCMKKREGKKNWYVEQLSFCEMHYGD
jgi:hypothetical protein